MEVVTIFDFLPHCGDVDDIFFLVVWRSAFDREHHLHPGSPLLVLLGVTNAVRWLLEEDDGEAESAKSEMMVASSVLL